jgi:predicted phage terminase large subunit-like protein
MLMLRERKNRSLEKWLKNISPQYNWDYPHIVYIRKYLEEILAGVQHHLILLLPPQHSKSLSTTIHFPAYYLKKNPHKRIIIGAYNYSYATDFASSIHRLLTKDNFQYFDGKQTASAFETSQGGFVKAFGLQSGITGKSADLIIIDDPIKSHAEADSQIIRNKIWNGFIYDIETREQKNTSYVIIMTHWHYDDLVSRLIKRDGTKENGGKWKVISMPALAEENDILGRKIDEPLCPELHSFERLAERRKNNPSQFVAMYQQRPEIDGGNIIKRHWWKYYKKESKPQFEYIIQSLDTAWETKKENDFSVCTTWGVVNKDIYLIDMWREKVNYPDLKRAIIGLNAQYHPLKILIEDAASGKAAIQELMQTYIPIEPITPRGGKDVRVHTCTAIIERGNCWLPEDAPWLLDFLDECSAFPKGKHDDIVDTVPMALNYIANFGCPISFI